MLLHFNALHVSLLSSKWYHISKCNYGNPVKPGMTPLSHIGLTPLHVFDELVHVLYIYIVVLYMQLPWFDWVPVPYNLLQTKEQNGQEM